MTAHDQDQVPAVANHLQLLNHPWNKLIKVIHPETSIFRLNPFLLRVSAHAFSHRSEESPYLYGRIHLESLFIYLFLKRNSYKRTSFPPDGLSSSLGELLPCAG